MSHGYTPEEGRQLFLDHLRWLVTYWDRELATGRIATPTRALTGLLHSILVMVDGCSDRMPAFRILAEPHPDDEAFCKGEGENWWPDGLDITESVHLHDLLYRTDLPEPFKKLG